MGDKLASSQRPSRRPTGPLAGTVSVVEPIVDKPVEVERKLLDQTSTPTTLHLKKSEEVKITELARALSYLGIKSGKRELINVIFGSEHPLLDPNFGKFSSEAWLERLASITLSVGLMDPKSYTKRIAGGA